MGREEALRLALKQIDRIKWDQEPVEEPDLATQLVLYMMEKNAEMRDALDTICAMLAGYAEQPNHMGDIYKVADAARAKASVDTHPKGGDVTQITAPF